MKRGNSLKSNSSFDASYMSPGGPTGFGTGSSSTMTSSIGAGSVGGTLPGSGSDADNLCSEMNNLMHDYEVMSRINDLVGTLKGNYKDINLGVTRSILADIQASIQVSETDVY